MSSGLDMMKQSQDSDWYNVPDIVVENVSRVSKLAAQLESRCQASEKQIEKLTQKCKSLQKQNDELRQTVKTLIDNQNTSLGVSNIQVQPQPLSQQEIQILKQEVLQQLGPDFFSPIIQKYVDIINSQLQSELLRVYETINTKISQDSVIKYVKQQIGDIKNIILQFKLKMQTILNEKADINQVNEILVSKTDSKKLSKIIDQLSTKQEVASMLKSIREDITQDMERQLSQIQKVRKFKNQEEEQQNLIDEKQILLMQNQISQVNKQLSTNAISNKEILARISEINSKTVSNTQQLSIVQAQSQQALNLAQQYQNKSLDDIQMVMNPILENLQQNSRQINYLQMNVEKCCEYCLKRVGGKLYERQTNQLQKDLEKFLSKPYSTATQ